MDAVSKNDAERDAGSGVSGVGQSWRRVPAHRWLLSRGCGRVRDKSWGIRSSPLFAATS